MKMNNFLLALILVIFFVSISSVNAGFGNDVRGVRDIVSKTNTTPTPEPEPPTNKTNTTEPQTPEPQTNTTEPQTPEPQTPDPQEPEYDYDVIPGTNIPAWDIDTSDFTEKVFMFTAYPTLKHIAYYINVKPLLGKGAKMTITTISELKDLYIGILDASYQDYMKFDINTVAERAAKYTINHVPDIDLGPELGIPSLPITSVQDITEFRTNLEDLDWEAIMFQVLIGIFI